MSEFGESSTPRWGLLIFGIFLIGMAFYLYSYLAGLENAGGSVRINVIIALIYNLLGKWGVAIVVGLIGVGTCWLAFLEESGD